MRNRMVFYLVGLVLSLLLALGFTFKRWDFTSDKRYTLSDASLKVLNSVEETVVITVYLEGDFPANFQQFQSEIKTVLESFENENSEIQYTFVNPIEERISEDTLQAMGIKAFTLPEEREGQLTQIKIFPYALMTHNNRGLVVPLLTKKQEEIDQVLKSSVEELEYNFIEGIESLNRKKVKNIGWLNNHQSLAPIELNGLYETLSSKYYIEPLYPFDSNNVTLKKEDIPALTALDALIIAKPREPFEDEEKLVLDQYIMHGGKVLWMMDAVNAEKDSLMRSGRITAFTNDLNLNDLLFAYGVRLKGGVIKDEQKAAAIKVQTGEVQGNPQYAMPQWPYLPLGIAENESSITKNLNPVLFQFASPIDTLKNDIQKTILYRSSPISDVIPTPTFVYLEDIVQPGEDSLREAFAHKGNQIMAVLLEGEFSSAYAGRFERTEVPNYQGKSPRNKMIVIADGDMAKNDVYQGRIPVPLGMDALTGIQYSNADFLLNCMDYLLDDSGLMDLRNRVIDQRLLDKQKVMNEKSQWKNYTLLIPSLFIIILMLLGMGIRIKKYKK